RPPVEVRDDLPAFEFVQDTTRVQVAVQCAWVLPAEDAEDWPALRLLHRLLDDGSTARLRRRIVDELTLAYHAGCDLEVYDGLSILTFDVETSATNVLTVVDALDDLVSEIINDGVGDDEWERIRRRYRFEMSCLRDAPSALCGWMGLQELHPPYVSVPERIGQVLGVAQDDLSRVCAVHLAPERRQLTVIGDLDPMQRAALRRRVHRVRAATRTEA
ncbi:MAG: insulinase family protein, partial [Myxococcota bacterium]|nr:insulinase family protein [Myxococcota bacterium]